MYLCSVAGPERPHPVRVASAFRGAVGAVRGGSGLRAGRGVQLPEFQGPWQGHRPHGLLVQSHQEVLGPVRGAGAV